MLVQRQPSMRALRRSQTSFGWSNNTTSPSPFSPPSSSWVHLRSVFVIVASSSSSPSSSSSSPVSSDRGSLKSPSTKRRRKHALLAKQWKSLFDVDGRLSDGGVRFLKKIRTGGVEPSIRAEVWPFLLGIYDVRSSKKERDDTKAKKRREYVNLRKQCRQISKSSEGRLDTIDTILNSPFPGEIFSARPSLSAEDAATSSWDPVKDESGLTNENTSEPETDSSDPDSSDSEDTKPLLSAPKQETETCGYTGDLPKPAAPYKPEDFATWQRIIRLDAVRANAEWVLYSPSQAAVSEAKAQQLAETVGLKDYDHLEPCRVYHAARLVAVLEAYAVYDGEIGYCQGMSDLLSPILSVIEEDHVAFWCFVGFMRKARHNFRLDEVGIRRQLSIVARIIRCTDAHLYRHLEKLQAEDCFFVYRMVVVLFRRELSFEQTLCLWEVMWADQAAIRAGLVKAGWRRKAPPPTDDLLLYAIAACVLQKRKLIMDEHSSMDEIMRDCNSMAGHLDVWKLLDDAHDLVASLHDKI